MSSVALHLSTCKKKNNFIPNKDCNWGEIYHLGFAFSDIFDASKKEIICQSVGNWPTHSREPCHISEHGTAGFNYIHVKNCQLSIKNRSKILCESRSPNWKHKYNSRIKIIDEKLYC